jgi:hypothetical protein
MDIKELQQDAMKSRIQMLTDPQPICHKLITNQGSTPNFALNFNFLTFSLV